MLIYFLKAWKHTDGETEFYPFSSEGLREDFLQEMEQSAKKDLNSTFYWEREWSKGEIWCNPPAEDMEV